MGVKQHSCTSPPYTHTSCRLKYKGKKDTSVKQNSVKGQFCPKKVVTLPYLPEVKNVTSSTL